MNAFQYLLVAAMALLSTATVRGATRGLIRKRVAVFWLLVWSVAAVAAIWPRGTVLLAKAVGIGRGADLVLYCGMFATFVGFFYIYTRFRRLDHALTLLVRQLAISGAVPALRGGAATDEHPVARENLPTGTSRALPGEQP